MKQQRYYQIINKINKFGLCFSLSPDQCILICLTLLHRKKANKKTQCHTLLICMVSHTLASLIHAKSNEKLDPRKQTIPLGQPQTHLSQNPRQDMLLPASRRLWDAGVGYYDWVIEERHFLPCPTHPSSSCQHFALPCVTAPPIMQINTVGVAEQRATTAIMSFSATAQHQAHSIVASLVYGLRK